LFTFYKCGRGKLVAAELRINSHTRQALSSILHKYRELFCIFLDFTRINVILAGKLSNDSQKRSDEIMEISTTDIKLGARLRAARKAAGYKTAKEFVEKNNIPASTYSQHETGSRKKPNDKILKTYSELLKISFEWLKTGEGNPFTEEGGSLPIDEFGSLNKADASSRGDRQYSESIKENLLKEILLQANDMLQEVKGKVDFTELAKITSAVYADIVNSAQDDMDEMKLIKPTLLVYKRLFVG
jgi:transcriptional regulator with XRE-family HTH domain